MLEFFIVGFYTLILSVGYGVLIVGYGKYIQYLVDNFSYRIGSILSVVPLFFFIWIIIYFLAT